MKSRTVFLLALIAVPASFSGSASSNAPVPAAQRMIQTEATCAAAATANRTQRPCSKPILIAQTPRERCIKTCQDIYNDGEPLQHCIKQCPAQ